MSAVSETTRYCRQLVFLFGAMTLGLLLAFTGVQQAWADTTLQTEDGFRYNVLSNGSIEITDYVGSDIEVAIPEQIASAPVTTVASKAFSGVNAVKVTVPGCVTTIKSSAFSSNQNLKEIRFSAGVATVGANAFYNCKVLNKIELADTITSIGNSAFAKCPKLKSVNLPSQLNDLSQGMFEGCSSLDAVVVGDALGHIELGSFKGTGLSVDDLSLPEGCIVAAGAFD